MSLLQNLSYKEYQRASNFSLELCEIIAKTAGLRIAFEESPKKPGELLLKTLDRRGYSAERYWEILKATQTTKTIHTYYRPQAKVAILIGNDKYMHLTKLVTPSIDCDSLGSNLKSLGFIVVTIKNTKNKDLKILISKVFDIIPEDSYCFIFYAGHGCELCNTKCMLNIDCPMEDIDLEHCITENYVLKQVENCKPELCVFIMDMCGLYLDRSANPKIYSSISTIEEYTIHKNLLVSYSTQSSKAAYEVLQIECSKTIDSDVTYELKTGDTEKIVPGASQYVNALCTRLTDDLDVSALLDKVHGDMENSMKKQRPIKVQCGVSKRSLYDRVVGDKEALLNKLKETTQEYIDNCTVY